MKLPIAFSSAVASVALTRWRDDTRVAVSSSVKEGVIAQLVKHIPRKNVWSQGDSTPFHRKTSNDCAFWFRLLVLSIEPSMDLRGQFVECIVLQLFANRLPHVIEDRRTVDLALRHVAHFDG